MSENMAKDILWPSDTQVLVRFVWLYVGQGSSSIVLIRDGGNYKCLLIDINLDAEHGGVDVPTLMEDLLSGERLHAFVNTHPHEDHLKGVVELAEKVVIGEVWHSGHKPGRKHDDSYKELLELIKKVRKENGVEVKLEGSREEKMLGEGKYYVLAPAEYVTDDIEDEEPEVRARRIHEQCAVLKFGTDEAWGILPGDADRDAFEKHIIKYHRERLGAIVLAASHHGSRSFFRYSEDDEPYREGLEAIDPEYVVISAPKQGESKHDHPHEDAVELYVEKVGKENVYHTGAERHCFLFDIFEDGSYGEVETDGGELAKKYPIGNGGGKNGGGEGEGFTKRDKLGRMTRQTYAKEDC